ncbi:MAG: hypothetical protein AAF790_14720, partial [Planctomycetota bacterium]
MKQPPVYRERTQFSLVTLLAATLLVAAVCLVGRWIVATPGAPRQAAGVLLGMAVAGVCHALHSYGEGPRARNLLKVWLAAVAMAYAFSIAGTPLAYSAGVLLGLVAARCGAGWLGRCLA